MVPVLKPLKRISLRASLIALCIGSLALPAMAKTFSIRAEATVTVPAPETQELGKYLASLTALRKAREQALPQLKTYEAFQYQGLSELELNAMALAYMINKLNYYDEASAWQSKREVRYKAKLDYDSFQFPDTFAALYEKDYGNILLSKYMIIEAQALETQITKYFQKLASSQDENFRGLLLEEEGEPLRKRYQAEHILETAMTLMGRKDLEKAIEKLEQAQKLAPQSRSIGLLLAFSHLGEEDFDQAQRTLSTQLQYHPNDSDLYLLRGFFYLGQGITFEPALADINTALEKDPKNGLAYLMQSMVLMYMKRIQEAQKSLDKACEIGMTSACGATASASPSQEERQRQQERQRNRRPNSKQF